MYLATLMETDKTELAEKLYAAESAIFARLQKLSTNTAPEGERVALDDAIRRLHVLKRERLRFPDWT
jgi:hypothetical protein